MVEGPKPPASVLQEWGGNRGLPRVETEAEAGRLARPEVPDHSED